MKICSRCERKKDEKEFYPSVLKRTKKDSKCRCIECEKQVRRERGDHKRNHARHREKRNQYCRDYDRRGVARRKAHLRRHKSKLAVYGLTPEQYDSMYQKQEGCCIICGEHQANLKRKLSVDHCHKTGVVRGLLCGNCNVGIGNLKDDPALLFRAIEYLEGFTE